MYGMNYTRARAVASAVALIGWGATAIGLLVFIAGLLDQAGLVPVISGLALAAAGLTHVLLAVIAKAALITAESSESIVRNTQK